ncbi:MAG TPA: 30S ribosomal protein S20 [Candidatus Saccharimonadales bacterium]|nr:30S ribosomal protein S20 [Candidatus Saccharimonadales bacterium]
MPIIKSAMKRMKQTIKRNERNVGIKRDIKDATKAFLAKPTSQGLSAAHSELDTAVKKGLLKKNTVARRKAQLAKVAKDAGVKLTPAKKSTTAKAPASKAAPKAAAVKKPATKTATTKTAAAKKPAAKATTAKKAPAKKPAAKKATK